MRCRTVSFLVLPLLIPSCHPALGHGPGSALDDRGPVTPMPAEAPPPPGELAWLMPFICGHAGCGHGRLAMTRACRRSVESRVMAIDKELGLVLIGVGSDDGVGEDWLGIVSRGGRPVGTVIVEKLLEDLCGVRVVGEANIKTGDDVQFRGPCPGRGLSRGQSVNELRAGVWGSVEHAYAAAGLLVLDIDASAEVSPGALARVYRGPRRIATIVIDELHPNVSLAHVRRSRADIRAGDAVWVLPTY